MNKYLSEGKNENLWDRKVFNITFPCVWVRLHFMKAFYDAKDFLNTWFMLFIDTSSIILQSLSTVDKLTSLLSSFSTYMTESLETFCSLLDIMEHYLVSMNIFVIHYVYRRRKLFDCTQLLIRGSLIKFSYQKEKPWSPLLL